MVLPAIAAIMPGMIVRSSVVRRDAAELWGAGGAARPVAGWRWAADWLRLAGGAAPPIEARAARAMDVCIALPGAAPTRRGLILRWLVHCLCGFKRSSGEPYRYEQEGDRE